MGKPFASTARVLVVRNADPKYNKKEYEIEYGNDPDAPIDGSKLLDLAEEAIWKHIEGAAPKQSKAPKVEKAPESPPTEVFLYNLEAVPIEKRNEVSKYLAENGARYREDKDLWESRIILPRLSKYLVK